jgi:hypothetical protein
MKAKIKQVLDRHKDSQGNLSSESFRDMLAVEIECNITKNMKQLAIDNPLSIEMWKGYKQKDIEEQNRNYNFIMSEMSEGEREHLEAWSNYKTNNPNQMEIEFND